MTSLCRTFIALAGLHLLVLGHAAEPAWPALEWKQAAPSPWLRVESPTTVVGGKLYLFGGFTEALGASNQIDVYDPASDSWTRLKDMPTRVTHLNPALHGRPVWLAGGFKGKHPARSPMRCGNMTSPRTPGPPGRRCPRHAPAVA